MSKFSLVLMLDQSETFESVDHCILFEQHKLGKVFNFVRMFFAFFLQGHSMRVNVQTNEAETDTVSIRCTSRSNMVNV